jgi:hypothetical protein
MATNAMFKLAIIVPPSCPRLLDVLLVFLGLFLLESIAWPRLSPIVKNMMLPGRVLFAIMVIIYLLRIVYPRVSPIASYMFPISTNVLSVVPGSKYLPTR